MVQTEVLLWGIDKVLALCKQKSLNGKGNPPAAAGLLSGVSLQRPFSWASLDTSVAAGELSLS